MSVLTKLFVVLLVILSIVVSAGLVVWVNRQQQLQTTIKNQKQDNDRLNTQNINLAGQLNALSSEKTQLQTLMQALINQKQQEIGTLQATVTDRDTQIAQLNNNLAQATTGQKAANDALTVAQKTIDQYGTQNTDLRNQLLELGKRNGELSLALNDRTNQFEVANRQVRDANEQITQLQADIKHKDEMIHKAGITENTPAVNTTPLVNVEGVIRSKQDVGGVPYATISVGSGDQVTKGMQFRVIDPSNPRDPFLGYLVVDRVEPHEAWGHVWGPKVSQIRPGVEVRTQL